MPTIFALSCPVPEPSRSDVELRFWALETIKAPAVTPEDYRLRTIVNDLLTAWDAERLLAQAQATQ